MHCTRMCAIIITGLIIDIYKCILILEYGVMLFKQKIKYAFPQWFIMRFFDNYVYIKILFNFSKLFIEKLFRAFFVFICYAYIIFDAVDRPVFKLFTVIF